MTTLVSRERVILFIADLTAGGAERVVSILANTWADRGDVDVLVVVLFDTTPFYALDPRVRYISLGMTPNAPMRRRFGEYIRAACGLRAVLRREKPAFVLSFMNKYNVFCLAAAIGTGTPVIASERDSPTEAGRKFNWAMRKVFYPRAVGIITQSEQSRLILIQRIHCRDVTVIPNPVSLLTVSPRASGSKIILNVGRLVEKKGQRDLLSAFAGLDAPGWRLMLCGDGPLRRDLESLAASLGIADRIEFSGKVFDVGSRLAQADLFVFPSHFEGFPNALAEAMLAGLPCVSYDCPTGPADMIRHGENGVLVPLGNINALQTGMQRLIEDPARREAMGREAAKLAAVLSPAEIGTRYFEYCLSRTHSSDRTAGK